MFKRPSFWLGLLLGAFAAFRLRFPNTRLQPPASISLRDLITDALVVCDSAGAVIETNAAASVLFGSSLLPSLHYPTGQTVPPGQHPLIRAFRSRAPVSGSYRATAADGSKRVLEAAALPLTSGGAAAVFRDVTAENISRTRQAETEAREQIMQSLCRKLEAAKTAEETAEAIVQQASCFFLDPLNVQVRLYSYSPEAQTLTCLASKPANHLKRPAKMAQAQPPVFPFDARDEALWLLYLLRKPCTSSLTALGEAEAVSAYAVPLVLGGVAIGHLGLSCAAAGAFEDKNLQEMLRLVATLAALALAVPQSASLSSFLESQGAAVREISQAISAGLGEGALADLVTGQVKRLLSAGVCTVSRCAEGRLSVRGQAFTDDLLHPNTPPDDPRLHGKTVQKAWRTQKTTVQAGIKNPSFEAGPWRALAGRAGYHTVTALPLTPKRGVLTVYTPGDMPLPEPQMKFLHTVAALLSISPPAASATADPAD